MFLDMAVLVDAQGEMLDNIENMVNILFITFDEILLSLDSSNTLLVLFLL